MSGKEQERPANDLELRTFIGAQAIEALDDQWLHLQSRLPRVTYCQTYQWQRSCWRHLCPGTSVPLAIAAYEGAEIVGVFPFHFSLSKERGVRVRQLTLHTNSHVPRNDFLVDPAYATRIRWESLIDAAQRGLGTRFDRIDLRDIDEHSRIEQIFSARSANAGVQSKVRRSALIDCSQSYVDNIRHVPGRTRRNIKRLERRAIMRSGLRFSRYHADELSPAVFQSFIDIEDDGWKGRQKTSILRSASLTQFYQALTTESDPHHACQINLLSVAGQDVAGQFGIVSNGTFHILKIGYRQSFADISPGNLLLAYTIKDASHSEHIESINLTTAPHWSKHWASATEIVHSHTLYQPTLSGRFLDITARARRRSGELLRSLKGRSRVDVAETRSPFDGQI